MARRARAEGHGATAEGGRAGPNDGAGDPPGPEPALKRESAGLYRTRDGRFRVEQSSGRWMLVDSDQTDELGMALVRGPFATLDEARNAIASARSGPVPTSELASRMATMPPAAARATHVTQPSSKARPKSETKRPVPSKPEPPPITEREFRSGDGDQLRQLWSSVGFKSLGDDDASLERMARRNPGLLLVAKAGTEIVASALGGWDGRRGWIYHVATSPDRRREGIARGLVERIETQLRKLGCPKVNAIVRAGNDEGRLFWEALRYQADGDHVFGKILDPDGSKSPGR